jgi:hypothetical protein
LDKMHAASASRILRTIGATSDLTGSIAVCVSALGLRLLEGSAVAGKATLGTAGDALRAPAAGGSSAMLSLRVAAGGGAATPFVGGAPAELRYPFLTFGVSNLKTAARLAAKEGSGVHGGGGGPLAAGAREAVFSLPGGGPALRVLHLFRRNPAVSVTLGAADPGAAADFFAGALGLRRLGAGAAVDGAEEAHPRPGLRSEVLASGAPHNTTCLVVEQLGAGAGAARDEGEGALTVGVEVGDVARARAAFLERGLPASQPSAAGSFVALCPDGYVFYVVQG